MVWGTSTQKYLKNKRRENREINLISVFEPVVHLFSKRTLTRERESTGNKRGALSGSGGKGGTGEIGLPAALAPLAPGLPVS